MPIFVIVLATVAGISYGTFLLENWCALKERSEHVSFFHEFHSVTSSTVILFGVLALLTLSIAARRYSWWPALARWGRLPALTESVFALGALGIMVLGQWLGIVRRAQISILCLGLLTIAWALSIDRREARRHAGGASLVREKTPL